MENTDEYYSFESILQRMLDNISDDIDKREGSIIYDALAPAAAEMAQMYIKLKNDMDLIFVDTAPGEYLDRIANQIGMNREEASSAIKLARFYDENEQFMDVDIGARFTCNDYYWTVIEKISTGNYRIEAEEAGSLPNSITGKLIPVNYIVGLGSAVLSDLLIPGEDEESDEDFRARYIENVKAPAFAGNITDYRTQVKAISGVGDLKVIPVWNGGGTVKLILLDSDYNVPSATLISDVQEIVFPTGNNGNLGIAPIGHNVTVVGAASETINIETTITLENNYTLNSIQDSINEAIEEYFLSLRKKWATVDNIVVRIAQLENKILGVDGILDISDTTINSQTGNIQLEINEVPILGTVVVNNE
ncbi:MAG: baseplate J/gp47 family protein [Clostridia bacterium]|nr:baseplate J/gp47 family protein [Clostridia bacterium]